MSATDQPQAQAQADVPHASDAAATTGAPPLVQLYDAAGRALYVPAADADHWRDAGYRDARPDPAARLADLPALWTAAEAALAALVAAPPPLDPAAEYAAAHAAAGALCAGVAAVLDDAARALPFAEGAPVALVDEAGAAHRVDPGQVDQYLAQGFRREGDAPAPAPAGGGQPA